MSMNLNKAIGKFIFCVLLFTLVTACQQASVPTVKPSDQNTNETQITENISIPVGDVTPDVMSELHTARANSPLVTAATGPNLLANPSFESGTNSWVKSCDTSVINTSSDSVNGLALSLANGCMYQDVIVQPDKIYTLSCQVKLSNTTGWSGMGFGVMDGAFNNLAQAPENQITGTSWATYTSTFTTPANSGFAAIWFYTDGAIVVDDCSFISESPNVPDPEPTTLIENGSFDTQSSWNNCGNAAAYAIQSGNLTTTATPSCVYQTVEAQVGADYRLSCSSKVDPGVYASITLSMLNSSWVQIATDTQVVNSTSFQTFDLAKVAPTATRYVAITFYAEGKTAHENCFLTTNTMATPVPLSDGSLFPYPNSHPQSEQLDGEALLAPNNLLANPSFNTQTGWTNCAPANASISGGQLNAATGACLYQQVNAVVGKTYSLTCKAKTNLPSYSIFTLNMLDVNYQNIQTKVQSLNTDSREWTVSLTAPATAKYVAVGFYTEGAAVYDYCYLSNEAPQLENEAAFLPNNLLVNPSFTTQAGWTNCAAGSATISGGQLNATPGVCFFQQINAEVGKTYSLTCSGSMDLPLYSVFTLNMLDVNYQSLASEAKTINTSNRQWRVSLVAPANSKYITVGFYTETAAQYDYCYLTSEAAAPLASEIIYAPVKPMEVLVPIYIDPAQDINPWNQVIATAQSVPTTVVVNPVIGGIEGCQEATFKTTLEKLQTNKVDTIGYIPTGYTATPTAVVKERIDRFKNCVGIDGVFFDEIKVSNQAEADYYTDICTYAKQAFGAGKFVVNAGTNIQIPITNEFCNIALIYEFYEDNWEDFAVFGYKGASTDAATSIMIHTSNTLNDTKKAIDLAYARKIDYVFATNSTVPNPWLNLGAHWTDMINYLAQKNAAFN